MVIILQGLFQVLWTGIANERFGCSWYLQTYMSSYEYDQTLRFHSASTPQRYGWARRPSTCVLSAISAPFVRHGSPGRIYGCHLRALPSSLRGDERACRCDHNSVSPPFIFAWRKIYLHYSHFVILQQFILNLESALVRVNLQNVSHMQHFARGKHNLWRFWPTWNPSSVWMLECESSAMLFLSVFGVQVGVRGVLSPPVPSFSVLSTQARSRGPIPKKIFVTKIVTKTVMRFIFDSMTCVNY